MVDDLDEVRTWTALLGRRRTFLLVPVGAGRVYCYADVSTRDTAWPETATADVRLVRELFGDFAGPVPGALARLDSATPVHAAPIEEVVMEQAVNGRVALIGDAAHATSPNMAQGAAMACEDALVLVDELTDGRSVPAALAAFATRRTPRTDWVREQTHRRDRTRALPGPVRAALLRLAANRMYRTSYRPLLPTP